MLMDYKNLIINGRSVRDFKETPVEKSIQEQIESYISGSKKLVPALDLDLVFYENSLVYERLQGVAGYKGFMIKAPLYLFLFSEEGDHDIENAGYVGERAVLKARDLGVDSCWVTFKSSDEVKAKLGLQTKKKLLGIIALGYEEAGHDKTVQGATKIGDSISRSKIDIVPEKSERVDLEEIVYLDKWGIPAGIDVLEERALFDAFSFARMAPSALNKQPWKFIIDGGRVILCINNEDYSGSYENRIDAGIAMLYFGIVLDITMFDSKWSFDGLNKEDYGVPSDYTIVGYCSI